MRYPREGIGGMWIVPFGQSTTLARPNQLISRDLKLPRRAATPDTTVVRRWLVGPDHELVVRVMLVVGGYPMVSPRTIPTPLRKRTASEIEKRSTGSQADFMLGRKPVIGAADVI